MFENRKKKRRITLGPLVIGDGTPVKVQSMTSTVTSDFSSTLRQVKQLEKVGCEIVRIAVPDQKSLGSLEKIVKKTKMPVIADIHFNPNLAIESMKRGVAGIRINPGNIGSKDKVSEILSMAGESGCCIRIGINSGSLDPKYIARDGKVTAKGLVDSALEFLDFFESKNFYNTKISIKSSSVSETFEANSLLDKACDYPIHLGVTESGTLLNGSIRSAIGLGLLLTQGIGDTIRVSLSADPVMEVRVAWEILKALGLRKRGVTVIACPTCARQSFPVSKIAQRVETKLSAIESDITVAVMGCIVNGPGEASQADIGIAGGKGKSMLFEKGKAVARLSSGKIEKELVTRVIRIASAKIPKRDK
jgi:(E)-4-hydroxy-3-methylbut-2-enyl-diphosphate synthase